MHVVSRHCICALNNAIRYGARAMVAISEGLKLIEKFAQEDTPEELAAMYGMNSHTQTITVSLNPGSSASFRDAVLSAGAGDEAVPDGADPQSGSSSDSGEDAQPSFRILGGGMTSEAATK